MKKNKWPIYIIGLILVFAMIFAIGKSTNMFSVFGDIKPSPVLIPEYSNVYCAECHTGGVTKYISMQTIEGSYDFNIYDCVHDDKGQIVYTYEKGCNAHVNGAPSTLGETVVYVCDQSTSNSIIIADAEKEMGIFSGASSIQGCERKQNIVGSGDFPYNAGQYLYVFSEVPVSGSITMNPYCLFYSANGAMQNYNGCDFTKLVGTTFKGVPAQWENGGILRPGYENSIQNVIIGSKASINNVDIVKNPKNDEWVYLEQISGTIYYSPINKEEDGNYYIDITSGARKTDSIFVCVPSLVGLTKCQGGIKVTVEDECTGDNVRLGEYVTDTQQCTKYCVNNKIVTKDCREIIGGVAPTPPTKEICTDGLDNDRDGLIDKNDPDCKTTTNASFLLILLSSVVGGVVTFYSKPLINKFPKKNKWVKPLTYTIVFVVTTIIAALIIKAFMAWLKSLFTISWW